MTEPLLATPVVKLVESEMDQTTDDTEHCPSQATYPTEANSALNPLLKKTISPTLVYLLPPLSPSQGNLYLDLPLGADARNYLSYPQANCLSYQRHYLMKQYFSR